MSEQPSTVQVFKVFPFRKGQKLHIEDGPRKGDWLVVDRDDSHVTLQCPVSGKQFRWPHFCYFVEESESRTWPEV